MQIGCVILNWNNYIDTKECINSILASKGEVKKKIVLVDNCSTDDSFERLLRDFGRPENIFFIKNEQNRGYAGGINSGIRYILKNFNCPYIIAMNNDIIIPDFFFDNMLEIVSKNNIDIASPVFLDYRTGKVKFEGVKKLFIPLLHHIEIKGNYGKLDWWPAEVVMGASMMFSSQFLKNELWLYEPFFLYCEEDEICIRAKMKGYKVGICGKAILYDKGKMSLKRGKQKKEDAIYFTIRNRFILAKLLKQYGYLSKSEFFGFNITFTIACIVLSTSLIYNFKVSTAIIKGVRDGFKAKIEPHYIYGS